MLRFVAFLSFKYRAYQSAQSLTRVLNCFSHFERSEFRLLPWPIFHGVDVQRQDFFFALAFHFLVESLAGFVAQPSAPRHLFNQRGHLVHFVRLIVWRGFVDVLHHVDQHVQPNEIGRAKRRGLRPAHRRPSARIHFFDGHAQRCHQPDGVQHRECSDAIGDEVGRILGNYHAFAEPAVAEFAERFDHVRRCFRPGNHLHQLHIARWIEEMSPGPVLLELFAHRFGDQVNGQSGSVGGYNRARLAELCHARQQFAFDLEIFRHNFDDPVGFGATRQVILKISDRHSFRQRRREKRRRLGFFRRLEPRAHNLVAFRGRRLGLQIRRNDIQ